jgi:hypothetical protein
MTERKPGLLDRLGRLVPGFEGYQNRENRRKADQQLRVSIAERLRSARTAIDDTLSAAAAAGQFAALEPLENLRRKLDRTTDLVRHAPAGYSAFFDPRQVEERDLDAIYEHDLELAGHADGLAAEIERLADSGDPVAACRDLTRGLDTLERGIRGRDAAVTGAVTSGGRPGPGGDADA